MQPTRGEVWLFDLGMAAKTRPVLVVNVAYGDLDRALVTVVPHTTQLRGTPFEISGGPVPSTRCLLGSRHIDTPESLGDPQDRRTHARPNGDGYGGLAELVRAHAGLTAE